THWPDGVTFFILQGLSSLGEKQMILFVILLLGYIVILGGNSMTLTDPKLDSPMYFFLANLSFVEMAFTTSSIPKMLSGFLSDVSIISVPGCFLQMHFFSQLSITVSAILTVMAYDRYVAICNPLHYTSIMTRPVQLLLITGAWVFSVVFTLPPAIIALLRPYCGPNVVKHGWCDLSSVRRLACADTSMDNIVSLSLAMVALLTPGSLILTSYALIGVSLARMAVTQRLKAFGTCSAHLTVVTISFSSASFVYISYRVGNFSPEVQDSDNLTSVFTFLLYTALTPFLNPLIYSLRNKELQESIRRILSRFRSNFNFSQIFKILFTFVTL
uniref:Odorant receptor, family 6, subfamily AT, member 1 n=1 Tax=Mastacembelus armatus TaxID=205130 RepID=A0A3Q3NKI0_9TELE